VKLAALPAPAPPQEQFSNAQPKTTTAPLFPEAVPEQVYLQVGVIDKGPAAIWGCRS
jgi:hypothetical protein